MTDERDKSSHAKESVAKTTARDVPFVKGAGADAEPVPAGRRPAQLPRDASYEQELAGVELAVLKDRAPDPSTKPGGGGRRALGHSMSSAEPLAASVTPESPSVLESDQRFTPEPPTSGGRAVASGTLLSMGAVDPRGKTERTLETPRMFFSEPDASGGAYFKPGKIPAVTVHQTLETETVKLSDSVDPRRAKTMPRIDRAALARAAAEAAAESAAPMVLSGPEASEEEPAPVGQRGWVEAEYDPALAAPLPSDVDGQIHASLSPFRDQTEHPIDTDADIDALVSSSGDAVTRPEPLAARRNSDLPPPVALPDPNTVPTHRDLPVHRAELIVPLAPLPSRLGPELRLPADSAVPGSEERPTTQSIVAEPGDDRPRWINFAAFAVALVAAVVLGLWLTSGPDTGSAAQKPVAAPAVPAPNAPENAAPADAATPTPAPDQKPVERTEAPATAAAPQGGPGSARPAVMPQAHPAAVAAPARASVAPAAPARKASPSKSSHESIF
jgi:hypothetical protein